MKNLTKLRTPEFALIPLITLAIWILIVMFADFWTVLVLSIWCIPTMVLSIIMTIVIDRIYKKD
jgi:hypothetical protein